MSTAPDNPDDAARHVPREAPTIEVIPDDTPSAEWITPTPLDGAETPLREIDGLVCSYCRKIYDRPGPPACPLDNGILFDTKLYADWDEDPLLGKCVLGRFTIMARLGGGSMGMVYRARQEGMGRDVALKILRYDRALDAQAKGRFEREAHANSLLASPHTVTVFDFGVAEDGSLFLAMELLEGDSLGQRLRRVGRLPVTHAVRVAREVAVSLAEAHQKGIIHRDIKPDNIFLARKLGPQGEVETTKVVDFGIAKLVHGDTHGVTALETQAGTVFGTPRYMSPEQAQGKALDARTDLYSLGVILFQMIAGRPPFEDEDAVLVMARHIKAPPPRLAEVVPEVVVPPKLEDTLKALLAKKPEDRPASAEVLVAMLDDALAGWTPPERTALSAALDARPQRQGFLATLPSWVVPVAVGGLAALVLLLVLFAWRSRTMTEPTGSPAVLPEPSAPPAPASAHTPEPQPEPTAVSPEALPPAEPSSSKKRDKKSDKAPPAPPSTKATAAPPATTTTAKPKYDRFD